jgi:hypothetical protein
MISGESSEFEWPLKGFLESMRYHSATVLQQYDISAAKVIFLVRYPEITLRMIAIDDFTGQVSACQ